MAGAGGQVAVATSVTVSSHVEDAVRVVLLRGRQGTRKIGGDPNVITRAGSAEWRRDNRDDTNVTGLAFRERELDKEGGGRGRGRIRVIFGRRDPSSHHTGLDIEPVEGDREWETKQRVLFSRMPLQTVLSP